MTQLEDYIKDKRYKEVSESLTVRSTRDFPIPVVLIIGVPDRQGYIIDLQGVHLCPTHIACFETHTRDPRWAADTTRCRFRCIVSSWKVACF